ncbi:hypothetical protein SS7213T_06626 [Staphylococcus simiae CCM 7213 = CCUG 51256]|uniref:Uncharacterized protein n=1 Tax=Staphylococcus simiae CCM 7213 = CCUG 51256 TaxID=911238 RepID=G5JIN7_9STAP|nr:hypothetical protein SS7213T_06626 [Staphylococcus simiae CCM 7213 = CCUG 51256]
MKRMEKNKKERIEKIKLFAIIVGAITQIINLIKAFFN